MRQSRSGMEKMAGQFVPFCLLVFLSFGKFYVYGNPPAELTLDVALVSPYDTQVEHYIGGKTKMEVKVAFPVGTTNAVSIELLPSTNVTIMALGEVIVTPPPNGYVTKTGSDDVTRHITDETLGQKVQLSTRAVIDLKDVTATAGGAEDDYIYNITFEAFVVSTEGLTDNQTHWVSAGVEYDNSNSIWVGQIAHYIRTGTLSNGKTASFSMDDVTELKRLSLSPVSFEAWVPYPNSLIAVEAISLSTTDDHLRVVSLKCVQGAGSNFEFGDPTMLNYPLLQEEGIDCATDPGGSRRLRVELGNVPNKGSRDTGVPTGEIDKLQFEALLHMKGTAVLNDEYPFGVGVEIDGSEVWVATVNITATTEDSIDFPLNNFAAVGGTTKEIGEGFLATASIEFPRGRGVATVTYMVETMKNGGGDPGVLITQAYVTDSGANVQCGEVTTAYNSTVEGGLVDIAYITITAANHGLNSTNVADDLIHVNIAMVGAVGYAVDGNYDVKITSQTAGSHTQTIMYTFSGTVAYDTNTNHTFELTSVCGENQVIPEGSTFDLILTVNTQRDSNPESLQIEFPIPANVSDGMFVVCGVEVVMMGKNLICFNPVQAVNSANFTTLSDGSHEYVAMNIKPACNMGLFDDPEEDKFVLKIKSKFRTGVTINKGEEYWYGIGSKYTSTQIWVAQYPLNGLPVYDFEGPAIITAINVANNVNNTESFPGSYRLTRSFDGANFSTMDIETGTPTDNGTHSIYALQKPVMGLKAGIITENCNSVCGVDYDFTYVSLKEYVDIFGDDSQAILNKMIDVFDNSSGTCMNLPVQGQSPPVFWARINTTLLNIDLKSFTMIVEGEGISCQRHGGEKVLQVSISYPVTSSVGRFHGDVKFCKNVNNEVGSTNTCSYSCMCPDTAECSEIIIFLANSNSGDHGNSWSLCDLRATNI